MKNRLFCSCSVQGLCCIRIRQRLLNGSLLLYLPLAASLVLAAAPVHAQSATANSSTAQGDSLRIRRAVDRAVTIARTGSAVRVAQANLDLAKARAVAAGARTPLSLDGGVSEAPNGNLAQGNLRLELSREVLTSNRRRAARAVADVEVTAAALELSVVTRQLEATIFRDLLRAAGSRSIANRLASEDLLLASAEDGVRARFAAGQARYVDVLRVRTERLRVQSDRSGSLAEERIAFAELLEFVPMDSAPVVATLIDTIAATALGESWQAALPAPPSIDSLFIWNEVTRRARLASERALANQALLIAEQRPLTELYGGMQRIGQANNGPALGPSFGFSVSLPFSVRADNDRLRNAAAQSIRTADIEFQSILVSRRAHFAAALERYQSARSRIQVFDAALLRGAREERESALAAYRTGSLSLLELIDFERALARAEIERVKAIIDAADAFADLIIDDRTDNGSDNSNETNR